MLFICVFLVSGALASWAQDIKDGDDVAIGKYRKIFSKVLGEERIIMVHTPEGYENGKDRYPVLYQLDGEMNTLFPKGVLLTEGMAGLGNMPPFILVAIRNTDRSRDCFPVKIPRRPSAGGADKFLEFLTSELFPFVEKNYRTANYRILAGFSNSAMFAVYAFIKRPDAFNAILAASPMLGWCRDLIFKETETLFQKKKKLNNFLYFIYGQKDYKKVTDVVPDYVKLLKTSAPAGLTHRLRILEKEGHVPEASVELGLASIFENFAFPAEQAEPGLESIEKHYDGLRKKYGFNIKPPRRVILQAANALREQNRAGDAIPVFKLAIKHYPDFFVPHHYLGDIYEKKGDTALALKHFKRAVELNPQSEITKKRIKELEKKVSSK